MSNIDDKINVNDLNKSLQRFGFVDYVVFSLMLMSCALIGVYFGFIEKKFKKKNVHRESHESEVAQEYLMGGRHMSVIPVALSLVSRRVEKQSWCDKIIKFPFRTVGYRVYRSSDWQLKYTCMELPIFL